VSKTSDLPKRAAVAVLLVGIAFAALWFGGLVFWLVVAAGGLLMLAEWADLAHAPLRHKQYALVAMAIGLAAMAPGLGALPFALALLAAGAAGLVALTRNGQLGFGILYVGLPVLGLVVLRAHPEGFLLTLWAMALVWASDTAAYFAGRLIGGPKLAPAISPNKTWAGFIGGMAGAGVFGAILAIGFALPLILALATPLLAALSQAGDLYESHLKRKAGVKDSGNLLPGHGGVLDRLDGLVAVAPVAALLVLAFA
jgi:phosphatidate cytidylyltransferase